MPTPSVERGVSPAPVVGLELGPAPSASAPLGAPVAAPDFESTTTPYGDLLPTSPSIRVPEVVQPVAAVADVHLDAAVEPTAIVAPLPMPEGGEFESAAREGSELRQRTHVHRRLHGRKWLGGLVGALAIAAAVVVVATQPWAEDSSAAPTTRAPAADPAPAPLKAEPAKPDTAAKPTEPAKADTAAKPTEAAANPQSENAMMPETALADAKTEPEDAKSDPVADKPPPKVKPGKSKSRRSRTAVKPVKPTKKPPKGTRPPKPAPDDGQGSGTTKMPF